jgi:hypothetical protein
MAHSGPHSWSTSSLGDSPDTSPGELSALGEHLQQCQQLSGRMATLRSGGEAVHGFIAGRFVTTLALAALLIGVLAWLL